LNTGKSKVGKKTGPVGQIDQSGNVDFQLGADYLSDIALRLNYAKWKCFNDLNEIQRNMSRRHKRAWKLRIDEMHESAKLLSENSI
jgi:hypothetical protein